METFTKMHHVRKYSLSSDNSTNKKLLQDSHSEKDAKDFGLSVTSRIKTFVFKYFSVAAKWVKTSRTYRLNIYTENFAYARAFNLGHD